MGSAGPIPDAVVVSPAARTRETWAVVAEHAQWDPEAARFDERLYAATWWDVLDVVRALPVDCARALVISHNPAVEDLAGQLASGASDQISLRELRAKFPTGAAAFIESEAPWSRWGGQCGTLTRFWKPRHQGAR